MQNRGSTSFGLEIAAGAEEFNHDWQNGNQNDGQHHPRKVGAHEGKVAKEVAAKNKKAALSFMTNAAKPMIGDYRTPKVDPRYSRCLGSMMTFFSLLPLI